MKKIKSIITIISVAFALNAHAQDAYLCKDGNVSFFSTTPIRDISAVSKLAVGYIKPSTKYIKFQVGITSFVFENALMQEHFNENYMESDKKGYEFAIFEGTINEDIDFTKDGVYNVTVTGNFTCHNVTQPRTITGTITIVGGKVHVNSTFDVKLDDHNIKKPQVVDQDIADSIAVTVDCTLPPFVAGK